MKTKNEQRRMRDEDYPDKVLGYFRLFDFRLELFHR